MRHRDGTYGRGRWGEVAGDECGDYVLGEDEVSSAEEWWVGKSWTSWSVRVK